MSFDFNRQDDLASDAESTRAPGSGPAVNLFRSLTHFFSSLIALMQTRLELLTTELQEEIHRAAHTMLLAFVALIAAMMGLFMAGITIIVLYWDTHRQLAALLVTLGFFAIAAGAALTIKIKSRSKQPPLSHTLAELKKDADQLRGEP